eukprot:41382-Prorocentrum_minimum.AAC.2
MAHVRVEPYLTCLRRLMVSELLWCYDGHVYSLCAASGEVEWAYHMGDQVSADPDRYTFGHFNTSRNTLLALPNPGSDPRPRFQPQSESFGELPTGDSVPAPFMILICVKCSPGVDQWEGLVWCGSHGKRVAALNMHTRSPVWDLSVPASVFAAPAFDPSLRRVYFATLGGTLLCVVRRCEGGERPARGARTDEGRAQGPEGVQRGCRGGPEG